MSQEPPFSDDPLPAMEPQALVPVAAVPEDSAQPQQADVGLANPDLQPQSSYGRNDPASLAAVQTQALADPKLRAADAHTLAAPDLQSPSSHSLMDMAGPVAAPAPAGTDFSNWDPHLAHLAQVGLIAADHWEEQFKPRIDQLHEDIDQVNVQLDDLEKAKRPSQKS